MPLNIYQKQIEGINQFKTRVLDSVQNRQFNQEALRVILQDTFSQNKVEVSYDSKTLNEMQANACSEIDDDVFKFMFFQNKINLFKNRNIEELSQSKKLNSFADFFGSITHEVKHGFYEIFCGEKQDILYDQCSKIIKNKDITDKIMNEDLMNLVDKCTDGDYYKSAQVSGAVTRIASKYGQKDNKLFQKIIFLSLLDDLKNEHEAYFEGFKAKRELLGDKARFYGMKFAEAIEDNNLMREIAQEAYFNKFVPVKNLNRYF